MFSTTGSRTIARRLLQGGIAVSSSTTQASSASSSRYSFVSAHHHHYYYRRSFHVTTSLCKRTVLVLGSSGSLGLTVAKHLARHVTADGGGTMTVIGADVVELPNLTDYELDDFIPLPHYGQYPTLADVTERLAKGVDYSLSSLSSSSSQTTTSHDDDDDDNDEQSLDAIIVASGGWQLDPSSASSSSSSSSFEAARAYGESMETMMRMNFYPVAAAGYIAQQYMGPQGLFVVMGATAALSPTPGMIGYGVSKAAAHYYVQTLGATTGMAVSSKALRKEGRRARRHMQQSLDTMTVVGMLPTMLDTPSNRAANPNLDFETQCTKPIDIAGEIGKWISTPPLRPHSGSLIKVYTNADGTHFHLVR